MIVSGLVLILRRKAHELSWPVADLQEIILEIL